MWPGITPMNVWEMTFDMWQIFAVAVDAWRDAREKESR